MFWTGILTNIEQWLRGRWQIFPGRPTAWPAIIKYTFKMLSNTYDICQCRMSTNTPHCCNCTRNSTALGGMWKCFLHEFTRLWAGKRVKFVWYVGGYWTLCGWNTQHNFLSNQAGLKLLRLPKKTLLYFQFIYHSNKEASHLLSFTFFGEFITDK